MKFSEYDIDKRIKDRLAALQFKRPTDIQYKSIFPILKGEDVFAVAPTGTGKTAAFVIPVLDGLLKNKNRKGINCLCMVPTRELAEQIADVFNDLSTGTDIKSYALFGGVTQKKQIDKLNSRVDILITTPGRMFDLISQGHLDISYVRTLILDEADLMLDLGFKKDVIDVLRYLPRKRQTLFFSATINKKVKSLAYDVGKNAIRIQISPKTSVARSIEHVVAFIEMDDKRFFLENIVKENEESRILAFVRTRIRAERVVKAMERVGVHALCMHGDVDQNDRFAILDSFKKGNYKVLVTTDVAARGIDIPNVEIVVNYDVPENPENYVHRCGRTGRGTNSGFAISFCSEVELELIETIEDYTGEQIKRYELSRVDYEQIKWDSEDNSNDWRSLLDEDTEW